MDFIWCLIVDIARCYDFVEIDSKLWFSDVYYVKSWLVNLNLELKDCVSVLLLRVEVNDSHFRFRRLRVEVCG